MDLALAKTFLEIVASGSLMRAAERLHVTQTAVSARVKALEGLLGRPLFVRNKSGATLTPAGERFLRHAATLVQAWERARQQVAVPPGRTAALTIGCEISLWDPLLLQWLLWMRHSAPDMALRAEVGTPTELVERVADGTLEIAIVYAPQLRPGLRIDLLIEEKLVLVSSAENPLPLTPDNYVYVDWGPEFAAQHSLAFPELSNPGVTASFGPLGREYVLAAGVAGYVRWEVVRAHVEAGRLKRIAGAPEFLYPAYAVYSESADRHVLTPALEGLRQVAGASAAGAARRPAKRKPG